VDELVVIINCTNYTHIHSRLFASLYSQNINFKIYIHESPNAPVRLQLLPKISSRFVVFLDQDVELQSSHCLQKIVSTLKNSNKDVLLTGLYLSDKKSSYLSQCYNFITNLWICAGCAFEKDLTVLKNASGGLWALENKSNLYCHIKDIPVFWGGEDALSTIKIQSLGYSILRSADFDVYHHNDSNIIKFISRAWRQGRARYQWNLLVENRASSIRSGIVFSRYIVGLML
jgi:hypothetical protein